MNAIESMARQVADESHINPAERPYLLSVIERAVQEGYSLGYGVAQDAYRSDDGIAVGMVL